MLNYGCLYIPSVVVWRVCLWSVRCGDSLHSEGCERAKPQFLYRSKAVFLCRTKALFVYCTMALFM